MNHKSARSTTTTTRKGARWLLRAGLVLAALTGLTLPTAACQGASGRPSTGTTDTSLGVQAPGSGVQTTSSASPSNGLSPDNRSSSSFTAAFAKCMRENGVANFPDPNGSAGQLGPASGIDPTSNAFQSALNGPCQSLAPPEWLSSGPVSRGGGS